MARKYQTAQELDKLENERKARLQAIDAEIVALGDKRREVQLRLGEGDDAAKMEIQQIAGAIGGLQDEADSIRLFLETIPSSREYARGVELESLPKEIAKMKSKLPGLSAEIEKKGKELQAAIEAYVAFLDKFDDLPETVSLGLRSNFYWSAKRFSENMVGDVTQGTQGAPVISIWGAMVLSKENFSLWCNQVESLLEKRIDDVALHARLLKGDVDLPERPAFCPRCYSGRIIYSDYSKAYECLDCRHDFEK